jgi:hypothetical protein
MQLPTAIKETRFFDVHYRRGMQWYRAHYPKVSAYPIAGEIAPTYFASAAARERIARLLPAAKVACIFRDPIARIESLYRAKGAYGAIRGSLEAALRHDPELLESARYATHLKAWRNAVGKDRVLPLIYDDLCRRPQALLDAMADFLGLERFRLMPSEIRRVRASAGMTFPRSLDRTRALIRCANWCRRRGLHRVVTLVRSSPLSGLCLGGGPPFPPMAASTRTKLYELLRPEIEELEALLQRDLASWKNPGRVQGDDLLSTLRCRE